VFVQTPGEGDLRLKQTVADALIYFELRG